MAFFNQLQYFKKYLGLFASHARPQRVEDGQVTITADGHHRVSADEDGHGLREAHNATHDGAERPVEQHQCGHEGERDAEEGHEYVTHCHVDDEIVADGPLADAGEHYGAHDRVADQGQHEDHRVERVDDHFEQRRR